MIQACLLNSFASHNEQVQNFHQYFSMVEMNPVYFRKLITYFQILLLEVSKLPVKNSPTCFFYWQLYKGDC